MSKRSRGFANITHSDDIRGGTVWKDDLQALIGSRLESPSSKITLTLSEGGVTFGNDTILATDYVVISHQFNHDWDEATIVKPHIHWEQVSANMPNWCLQYRWKINGQPKETSWTNLAWESNAFTYTSGTLNQITGFGDITPPANAKISAILQLRLTRDTTNVSTLFAGADPETNAVIVINEDTHYQVNSSGSLFEFIKGF